MIAIKAPFGETAVFRGTNNAGWTDNFRYNKEMHLRDHPGYPILTVSATAANYHRRSSQA